MRKLDFIVFGLARSGTTALTNLIRANRSIFCGAEFFTPQSDHSRIDVPQAFYDEEERFKLAGKVPRHINDSMEDLRHRDKSEITLYGNKFPLYLHFLDRIMSELDHPKAILAYRDYRACARSYERRSQNPEDTWPSGRRSIFAGLKLIHILKILAMNNRPRDILVVPNRLVANRPYQTLLQISEHLQPGRSVDVDQGWKARLERTLATARRQKQKPLTPKEQTVFNELDKAGVNDLFPSGRCARPGEIQGEIRKAVAKLPEDHIGYGEELAREHDDPAVREYFEKWKDMAQNLA